MDPAALTDLLRAAGALPAGRVTTVEHEPFTVHNSRTGRLRIGYSTDPGGPASVIVKRNADTEWSIEATADEVRFYQLAAGVPGVVPCLAAEHDPATGESLLVLADLGGTHRPPASREELIAGAVPDRRDLDSAVDCLADAHRYWWEAGSDAFVTGHWSRDEERFGEYLRRRTGSFEAVAARLPAGPRGQIEELLAGLPGYWRRHVKDRFAAGRQLTLVHDDAYLSNFLCPREGIDAPAYLLDWQSAGFDIPGLDLVNMCATFWPPEQRRELERSVLRRYQARLDRYTFDEVCRDYRLGLIHWLLVPMQDAADGSADDYWAPKLACLAAAYADWECADLL